MSLKHENIQLKQRLDAQNRTIETLMAKVEDGFALHGSDVRNTADSIRLEQLVQKRTRDLRTALSDLQRTQTALLNAQKLESIGQLAAGIAHEINTPMQYIGGNAEFLQQAISLLTEYSQALRELVDSDAFEKSQLKSKEKKIDFVLKRAPTAIEQTLQGVAAVSQIVRAMKEFSHPGTGEKVETNINDVLHTTVTVCRNEWKYVADIVYALDDNLPKIPCMPGEINQVFLNIIVNAAHAIADKLGEHTEFKGQIGIATSVKSGNVVIEITDNGSGIPEKVVKKIFDPFFTTKGVGKGTGQGLAIARSIVLDKHQGSIDVETEEGVGTKFIITLPVSDEMRGESAA